MEECLSRRVPPEVGPRKFCARQKVFASLWTFSILLTFIMTAHDHDPAMHSTNPVPSDFQPLTELLSQDHKPLGSKDYGNA